ncbi:unnamed protein product, partial [Mesorhabditis spiculigera]
MSFLRQFARHAAVDLANQYAIPVRSVTGSIISRISDTRNRPLYQACIDAAPVGKDDRVLDVGYGRGAGLRQLYDVVGQGKGILFGVERSQYMDEVARKRFALELSEEEKLQLHRVFDLRHMPYPNDFFDVLLHVDLIYFVKDERLEEVCREFFRVLQPGHKVVSAMEFAWLAKLEKWGLLTKNQCDPVRYLTRLEQAGFEDVRLDYLKTSGREIQVLCGRKPEADSRYFDPEHRMELLEKDVKRQLLLDDMLNKGYKPSKEDLELLKEVK